MDAVPIAGLQHRGVGLCGDDPAEEALGSAAGGQSRARESVRPRVAATASSGEIVLESKGHIIPAHQILVSPKVSGMVVKLMITESQRVAKGDVLAELEDTEYRADRDRAAAALETAKQNLAELVRGFRPEEIEQTRAELAESQAQLVQLEADYKRAAELYSKARDLEGGVRCGPEQI